MGKAELQKALHWGGVYGLDADGGFPFAWFSTIQFYQTQWGGGRRCGQRQIAVPSLLAKWSPMSLGGCRWVSCSSED